MCHFLGFRITLIAIFSFSVCGQVIVDTAVGGRVVDGIPANRVDLVAPYATAVGPDGSIYFSELNRHVMRRIRPDGILETIAGTGLSGFSGDGGPAVEATLYYPSFVAVDRSDNVYFNDYGNRRIRVIDSSGVIDTVAGTGIDPASGSGSEGPALLSQLGTVFGLAVDAQGTVYFSTFYSVWRLTSDGRIERVAGTDHPNPSSFSSDGDGGPAISAHMSPGAITIGPSGELFIADTGTIRRVGLDGLITTIAGSGHMYYPMSRDQGPSSALEAEFGFVTSLAVGSDNSIYVGELISFQVAHIRRINPEGYIETIAGTPNLVGGPPLEGLAKDVHFYGTGGLSIDENGIVYLADSVQRKILALSTDGFIRAVAGSDPGAAPNGAVARETWLANPAAIAFDHNDVLYIAETAGCRIRRVSVAGTLETVAGTGRCSRTAQNGSALNTDLPLPSDLTVLPNGDIYFASLIGQIFRISVAGQVELVEGATGVRLASDSSGRLYFLGDAGIARLTPGSPPEDYVGRFGSVVKLFVTYGIYSLAVDPADNLYFAQFGALTRIGTDGTITRSTLNGWSNPSRASPLAIDAAGVRYFVSGVRLTRDDGSNWGPVAAEGSAFDGARFNGDGTYAFSAGLGEVTSLALNRKGQLYFIDSDSRRIRFLSGTPPSQKPVISGIVNAASHSAGPIAPGERISIFGQRLTTSPQTESSFRNNQLPYVFRDVQVLFNYVSPTGNSLSSYPGQIINISPNQIDVFVPYVDFSYGEHSGSIAVTVNVDGVRSSTWLVPFSPTAMGLFTADDSGSGPGMILNQDGSVNGPDIPRIVDRRSHCSEPAQGSLNLNYQQGRLCSRLLIQLR